MNSQELHRIATLVWEKINTIDSQKKTKEEQIEMIKPILSCIEQEARILGRSQVLNHLKNEIHNLSA